IGSTGPVDALLGTFGNINFMPTWEGHDPVKALGGEFNVHVAIENDADAAALGEARWGAGLGKKRLVYVTVGTGIGVAIIIDGKIYRGLDGAHPEIGHHVVEPSGPLCSCGAHGCWETLAAGPAMVSWVQSEAPDRFPLSADLTAKEVCELATQGDAWACRAVKRHSRYLGIGLANVITFFVPDTIVLGGSMMNSLPLFIDGIRGEIRERCCLVPATKVELKAASLGKDAALAGAASVWYHRFAQNGE
ncbi:MAG: ROK family protein, partial [Blastocatellia bacterium]